MDYMKETIDSLHKKLSDKELTAEDLTNQTLSDINSKEDKLNTFITVNDKAIDTAKKIDEDGIRGPLSGIPIAIKDNIVTNGLKTTAASKILYNFMPVYNATVMDKLDKAGAIDIGKTNLDEFAMGSSTETSYFGTSVNPWDFSRVPGGSSGGSAAAVASGEVIAALGTDTGGSIRQPAAFNGIFGIKPTYGRVSRWGVIAFASSLDQVGVMSKRVEDSAKVLSVISGHDDHDSTSSAKEVPDYQANLNKDMSGVKIAVPKEFWQEGTHKDVLENVNKALDAYKKMGATVEEVSLPTLKHAVEVYYVLASSEASSNLQRYDGVRYGYRAKDVKNINDLFVNSRSEGFGDEVKRRIMLGTFALSAGAYDAYFKKAAEVRTIFIKEMTDVLKDYDLIMGPSTTTPAFKIGEKVDDPLAMYMNDILTIPANLAGLPAASVPAGLAEGLPVGLQIIGKPFAEQDVLNAAYALQEENKFYEQIPTALKGED
ncbi:Asp-tRNA(Asn)/Glu-tRNA(Gln) amidotransferase subunit GatA [Companilactobacillus alimentarius]|uniref:Glutamyl-tRNA(Gln) amidotransferase subunit A n=1 Tax=Companilactobacillus alimentarius DSM 20249 TaxID=1423720 RepID=A0A2K9HGR0_9LACO|nr:Asp-tRNA(Asn)/Glu-tRNA(Gln) amidotransferase subunit GatA [Companilactobacillus alimentarius]AUI71731.1 aspartyl/glutamyl-tRNA amidotransferase subunit A [Companilactobacillus alimentarius DSM 20249]KRK76542.1 aspartyl glutamyl-tRNA amidotransferase subunit A [Companilactobacillus alimentarius DSM 20249]MDT6953272.1 Asp-tRNA(Asn)/Glu-tRNA(Gln) amidotransferase subunit GatA [Companilactobacillus alimentarius]GEO45553.1 glutamyl-tRNA(Gln) amidotransferase subunit A [Companilactobacillus alimen